jgi:photosystem II stability/assembly factor-like uncharacterized protein
MKHLGVISRTAMLITVLIGVIGAAMVAAAPGNCPTLVFRDRPFDALYTSDQDSWIVGYPGLIMHSVDGGRNWQRQCDIGDLALYSIAFADAKNGWVVGRSGMILHSADGGQTWKQREPLCSEALFDVTFADAQHGWIVGNFGRLSRTTDGGQNWSAEIIGPMSNASINTVVFLNANHGFIGGEYPIWEAQLDETIKLSSLSNVFVTKDGGTTWQVVEVGTKFTINDLYFEDALHGWGAGAKGTLIKTDDGGVTWRVVPTGVNAHLLKIAQGPDGIWLAGTEGILLKVIGDKVEPVSVNAYSWLSAVAFSKAGNGVVVGGRGTLLSTQDNGAKWQLYSTKP